VGFEIPLDFMQDVPFWLQRRVGIAVVLECGQERVAVISIVYIVIMNVPLGPIMRLDALIAVVFIPVDSVDETQVVTCCCPLPLHCWRLAVFLESD
jgi:hypothetical protein